MKDERPALNTLLLECCLDAHAQLRLGNFSFCQGLQEGNGLGERGRGRDDYKTFSCSRVAQVWSPKVASTTSLLAGQPWASHFTSRSLWGFIPISTSNASGNSHDPLCSEYWGSSNESQKALPSWSWHSDWWWAYLSHPWNRDASLSNLPHGVVLKSKRDITHSSWYPPQRWFCKASTLSFRGPFLETLAACSWPQQCPL